MLNEKKVEMINWDKFYKKVKKMNDEELTYISKNIDKYFTTLPFLKNINNYSVITIILNNLINNYGISNKKKDNLNKERYAILDLISQIRYAPLTFYNGTIFKLKAKVLINSI